MKKIIALLLALCVLVPLASCATSGPKDPGTFYYRRSETEFDSSDGVIAPEIRELSGIRSDTGAILESYFEGPVSRDLTAPFPRDTVLIDWRIDDGTLYLTLSRAFSELSGIDLTIACACIARTALELIDVTSVSFNTDGILLNGSPYIVLTAQDLNFADDSVDKLRTNLTLYYADEKLRYLIGHNVSLNLATHEDVIGYLIEQLMLPPEDDLNRAIPRGAKLLDYTVSDGVCSLNFSREFESNAFYQSYAQRNTLLSIVNTLTQLNDIDCVEFYVEGSMMVHYRNLSISKPLVFDESAIGPVRTAINEFDATLYVSNDSELYLAAVPTRIRQSAGISQAELIVNALISYQNENGFYTEIPKDTIVNSVTIRNGTCRIDLSSAFIEESDHLLLSVRAIVASVCALEGIEQARITIDGAVPDVGQPELFESMSPSNDWFL